MNIRKRILEDTEFLSELFIDPRMINGNTDECDTEVGKWAIDIYNKFENSSEIITLGDIKRLTLSKGSQIGDSDAYLAHVSNTAGIFKSLVISLEKINSNLDLPHPDVAFATGLIHDLNATFSDYKKGGQQSKEFDQYLLAKRLGFEKVASQVAMHSDYLGGVRLMTKGVKFPKKEAYGKMMEMLRGEGPLSYEKIFSEFQGYMEGKDRFSLMLLTISDYLENGKPYFDLDNFDGDFKLRSEDIVWRYYGDAINKGNTPSLLGQALVEGGLERIDLYRNILLKIIENDNKYIENIKLTTNFFRG